MKQLTLKQQRDADLRALYQRIIHLQSVNLRYMKRSAIVALLATEPAPRFYLTEEQAGWAICQYYRNGRIPRCRPMKQAMILDLVDQYEKMRKEHPHAQKNILYKLAVEQPAKSFYMSNQRIREIIFNYSCRANGRKQ